MSIDKTLNCESKPVSLCSPYWLEFNQSNLKTIFFQEMQLKEVFCPLNQKRLKREKNEAHKQEKKKTVNAPGYRVNVGFCF